MKKIIPLFLMLLFSLSIKAQFSFVIQNNGTSTYRTINEAYENAVNGDTIYLPGGSFDLPSVEKSLAWIGVGYHPDSTAATYYTRINNPAIFTGNTDNTFMTGIHFVSNVTLGSPGDDAMDVVISRCRVGGTLMLKNNDGVERNINTTIRETIIDGNISANLGANINTNNSIVRGICQNFRSSFFDRVIFTYGSCSYSTGFAYEFTDCQGCFITNSIFNYKTYNSWKVDVYNNSGNDFKNNIFAATTSFPQGPNTGKDNITAVVLDDLFENIDGNIADYSYQHDLHLKEGSAGVGAGLLNTDIGIYDGTFSFKEGGLPFTPHISVVNIATESEAGMLQVQVKVSAQEK